MPHKASCRTVPVTDAPAQEAIGPEGREQRITADAQRRWKEKGSPEGQYEEAWGEATNAEKNREHEAMRQRMKTAASKQEKRKLAVLWQYAVRKKLWSEEATVTTHVDLSGTELRILASVAMEAAGGEEKPILPHPDDILLLGDLAEALEDSLNIRRRR